MRREQQQRLQTESRVDWFAILDALNRRGLNTTMIAVEVEIPRATILGWKQGREPCHADGERLVGLWLRMTGEARDALPMTNRPPWLD
ncbi:hypothetical protein [Arenimonas sp.]|uniref:hypothetical protein n=1 Tax=Arenimonas sp. TaxID=1872635 RepID=UPI0039E2ACBD